MDLGLAGKRTLITGASRGIGKTIAVRFAEQGCDLYLTARSREALEAVPDEIRARHSRDIAIHACDMMERRSVAAPAGRFAEPEHPVNNAGATPTVPILE